MFDGFRYTFGQIALWLLAAAVLGGIVGWMIRARWSLLEAGEPQTGDQVFSDRLGVADNEIAAMQSRMAELEAELETVASERDANLTEMRARGAELADTQARVAELEAELVTVADEKDTEMGRLESGAIGALDSTIANHQRRIETLEKALREQSLEAEEIEHRLFEEERRADRLQEALAERDNRIAELVADQNRRSAPLEN